MGTQTYHEQVAKVQFFRIYDYSGDYGRQLHKTTFRVGFLKK